MRFHQQLALVPEFTITEAAAVLSVDRRTVKALITSGVLRARVAGLPTSRRPRYRIPKSEVLAFRNNYAASNSGAKASETRAQRATADNLHHIHFTS